MLNILKLLKFRRWLSENRYNNLVEYVNNTELSVRNQLIVDHYPRDIFFDQPDQHEEEEEENPTVIEVVFHLRNEDNLDIDVQKFVSHVQEARDLHQHLFILYKNGEFFQGKRRYENLDATHNPHVEIFQHTYFLYPYYDFMGHDWIGTHRIHETFFAPQGTNTSTTADGNEVIALEDFQNLPEIHHSDIQCKFLKANMNNIIEIKSWDRLFYRRVVNTLKK